LLVSSWGCLFIGGDCAVWFDCCGWMVVCQWSVAYWGECACQ